MRKVKVCKRCSNFDIKEIKKYAKEVNCKLKFGCLSKCRSKHIEFKDKYFGIINDKLYIYSSKEEFFKQK